MFRWNSKRCGDVVLTGSTERWKQAANLSSNKDAPSIIFIDQSTQHSVTLLHSSSSILFSLVCVEDRCLNRTAGGLPLSLLMTYTDFPWRWWGNRGDVCGGRYVWGGGGGYAVCMWREDVIRGGKVTPDTVGKQGNTWQCTTQSCQCTQNLIRSPYGNRRYRCTRRYHHPLSAIKHQNSSHFKGVTQAWGSIIYEYRQMGGLKFKRHVCLT